MPILGTIASQISGHLTPPDTGAMFPLGMVQVGSGGASDITFTSIPSTYTHLQIRFNSFNSTTAGSFIQINGDTASNYSYHYLGRAGSATVVAGGAGSASSIFMGNTASGSYGLSHIIDILDYKNTNKNKTIKLLSGTDSNGAVAPWVGILSGAWYNTSAITSLKLFPTGGTTFTQYTQAALYGIKGA